MTHPGRHVLSILAQHFPYRLSRGRSWDEEKEKVADLITDRIQRLVPNLKRLVVGRMVLSPLDLERVFGLSGGDVYHGRLDPDQMFSLRPHPLAARYATPVAGLYLCGAGAHPGGGVSGAPGHNAAHRVLKDLGRG
jgi:phytoene dehydrogenase-like protein